MSNRKLAGIISLLGGIALGIFCAVSYVYDTQGLSTSLGPIDSYYTYQAPLAPREMLIVTLSIIAVIAFFVGLIFLVFKKNED